MFTVFAENEAGSATKHHHDEKALTSSHTEEVSRPYPPIPTDSCSTPPAAMARPCASNPSLRQI